MGGKGKKKSTSSASSTAGRHGYKSQIPKIVEDVNESDDEEIPEDEAFNSEDERIFGHFFVGGDSNVSHRDSHVASSSDEEVTSGEDSGDDDDDDEEGDDDDDGGQYMLDLLNKLDGSNDEGGRKSKIELSSSQMAKIPESDYSNSISKKGLTLDNLMEGIQDTQGFRDLQKTFSSKPATTPAPLDRNTTSRVERKVAYKSRSKDISRWVDIIQQNRQAESLDFKPKERLQLSRDVLVEKFLAKTSFEREIEEALQEAGQQDEEAVLRVEEKALQDDLGANRLTMEEYKRRRGQLAQIRALMFYHERKRHQMKKIKSKKYRRIRKKQRDRLKESAIESAMEEDQDLAKELKEKEEVARIQERMTLAHKNTSKWAKRILKRGKNVDVDTRRALSAQIKRGDDLRRKIMGSEEEDSDENSDDENLIESARKVLQETEDDLDPSHGKTGLFKLSFMRKGVEKQREQAREEARKLLGELEGNEIDDYDDMVQNESSEQSFPEKDERQLSAKEMSSVLEKGELVASSLEFGNSNAIATSNGIEIDLEGTEGYDRSKSFSSQHAIESENSECVTLMEFGKVEPNTTENSTISSKRHKKVKSNSKETNMVSVGATKLVVREDSDEANPWMKTDSKKTTNTALIKKTKRKSVIDVKGATDILDAHKEDEERNARETKKEAAVSGKSDVKKITSLTQEELVRRAFVGRNASRVEEEFKKEKEAMVVENDPTRKVEKRSDSSEEVVGWGSWTGQGAPPPKPRKLPKKLQAPRKKKEDKRKRSDDYKPDVIINQKRLKKTANNFMLADVPHPYASRAEYEHAMLGGVGREWNVSSSFKNMTRPEILTRSGKIIQPISKKAKQPRAAAKF
jgi:U3 small nucleolar RNA-associated protein 14